MKFFEKPAFRWKEPRAYLKAKLAMEESRSLWWHKPALMGVYALMMLSCWAMANLNPNKHPPSFEVAVGLAVGSGLLLTYGLTWLETVVHIPSEVRMFSPRILRQQWGNLTWDYSKIRGFEWVSGPEYHVLMLKHGPHERVLSLGLPLEMDTYAVSAFLLSKGVPHASAVT